MSEAHRATATSPVQRDGLREGGRPSDAPQDAGFPKRLRLRERREFIAIQRGGRRVGTEHFTLHGRRTGTRPTRLGITVSRKVGKATVRNRLKRLLREAFRLNRGRLAVGMDVVVVARPGPLPAGLADVARELLDGIGRLARARDDDVRGRADNRRPGRKDRPGDARGGR